ncbi:MAG: tRNA pseudouridine(38-40) synthase TruA [Myxococcota bacterium]
MAKAPPELPYGVRLTLAYEGTDFHGWQTQPGLRTVQSEVEGALRALGVRFTRLRGCSRTDAGVHAAAQVAAFAVDREIPPHGWRLALNGLLPADVAVSEAFAVDRRYDPRFDSLWKRYRYVFHVGPGRNPLSRRFAWQLGPRDARPWHMRSPREALADYLDLEAMREACARLVGEHDFHAFRAMNDKREQTVRVMRSVDLESDGPDVPGQLSMVVVGNAFMKQMVRIFAGTLIEVGRQRYTPDTISALLAPGASRRDAGPTAPPQGLTLEHIELGRGDWQKGPR